MRRSTHGFQLSLYILLTTLLFISKTCPSHNRLSSLIAGLSANTLQHRFYSVCGKQANPCAGKSLLICILLVCGDIESNPGPTSTAHVYPCGLCERPVTCDHYDGLCCDGCDIWHHRSCIELCSADYDMLVKHSHVQWLCCKCDSVNITSFTYRSFELTTSNPFYPLTQLDSSVDSFTSNSTFSPLHTSSPTDRRNSTRERHSTSR